MHYFMISRIMQLFSIGLFQLNDDGTAKHDPISGDPLQTYSQMDIMNMARVWTGFRRANNGRYNRGNSESRGVWSNRVDPLILHRDSHDRFPKSDLVGGYIGDSYPLCADLPDRDHLRKGAIFRALGSRTIPELQYENRQWDEWDDATTNKRRLVLDAGSPLYDLLCDAEEDGVCTYPGKVILASNLDYSAFQSAPEYYTDSLRSFKVGEYFYEYVRPPCVHRTFFPDSKKVFAGRIDGDFVHKKVMCADPLEKTAVEMCCEAGWDSSIAYAVRGNCRYYGERMRFAAQEARCAEIGREMCTPTRRVQGDDVCTSNEDVSYSDTRPQSFAWHHWTTQNCMLRVKVDYKNGLVARVDYPEEDAGGKRMVTIGLGDDTLNYFRAAWTNGEGTMPYSAAECNAVSSCYDAGVSFSLSFLRACVFFASFPLIVMEPSSRTYLI